MKRLRLLVWVCLGVWVFLSTGIMKKSELLTIEKLKYVFDKESSIRRHDVAGSVTTTAPSVTSEGAASVKKLITQNHQEQQQQQQQQQHLSQQQQHTLLDAKARTNFSNSVLKCVGTALGPILPSDNRNSDGRIASIVYLICLTTAGVVMNITAWLQKDDKIGITTDHIDGFLITCICPSLVWSSLLLFYLPLTGARLLFFLLLLFHITLALRLFLFPVKVASTWLEMEC